MANPTTVSIGTTIAPSWGNAVVSRVVGIYASLAAAETDGRTDDGALVTLSNGTLWFRWGSDWHRVWTIATGTTDTAYELTQTAIQDLVAAAVVCGRGDQVQVMVTASAVCQVTVAVASLVEVRIGLSRTGGSSWNNSQWFSADLGVGEHVLSAMHTAQVILTGDLEFRMECKASPMASTGDVIIRPSYQVQVDPDLYVFS